MEDIGKFIGNLADASVEELVVSFAVILFIGAFMTRKNK